MIRNGQQRHHRETLRTAMLIVWMGEPFRTMLPDIDPRPDSPAEPDFDTFRAGLLRVHQPADLHEKVLVEEFIGAAWDLQQSRRVGRLFWSYTGEHYYKGDSGIAQAQFQEKEARFRTHFKYRVSAERSYYRALAALNDAKKHRPRAVPASPVPDSPADFTDNPGFEADREQAMHAAAHASNAATKSVRADVVALAAILLGIQSGIALPQRSARRKQRFQFLKTSGADAGSALHDHEDSDRSSALHRTRLVRGHPGT